MNYSIIASVSAFDWDKMVAILSILGGIFGGIPTIWNWISKPRLYIKDFKIQESTSICFSIANKKWLSKDVTELNVRCLINNNGKQIGGHYTPYKNTSSLGFSYKVDLMNGISVQALPCGTFTDNILFSCIDKLPEKFEFYV